MAPKSGSRKPPPTAGGTIVNQAGLRWKRVPRPSQAQAAALSGEGAILGLEEVDNVEVVYEELPGGGRKVVFRTLDPLKPGETLDSESDIEDGMAGVVEDGSDDEPAVDGEDEPWSGIQDDAEGAAPVAGDNDDSADVPAAADADNAEPAADDAEEPVVLTAKEKKARERKAKLALEKAERKRKLAEEGGPAAKLPALEPLPDNFDDARLPAWRSIKALHPAIKHSLLASSFVRPSPIQAATLPAALAGRDVVGVAQTGSGKTLAYGLPIIDHILRLPAPVPSKNSAKRKLQALILAPTRELALQVSQHLAKAAEGCVEVPFTELAAEAEDEAAAKAGQSSDDENETAAEKGLKEKLEENPWAKPGRNGRFKKKAKPAAPTPAAKKTVKPTGPKPPPRVSVGSIVGGMSVDKQTRILKRGVDILVATPGRLWDLIGEDESIAQSIREVKFLVIDEADRMIEAGHFQELESIVSLTHRASSNEAAPVAEPKVPVVADLPVTGKANPNSEAADRPFEHKAEGLEGRADLQTFVFSATMERELQKNLKRFKGARAGSKKKQTTTLDDLFEKLDFRDENPEVVDLSTEGGVVSTLQESQVNCLATEKDLYLYYFLLRYPGRSIVFFGSIDGIRRAIPLLELLKLPVFPLHSDLQQKQRLKNLDRFKSTPNAILLATDIAARGLDIPSVDHVIHYQLPRTADVYVHRSGRTARAMREGFSLQICGPEEKKLQKLLMKSFGRTDEIPELPAERSLLEQLRRRIALAREVETANHKMKKKNHEKNWLKEAAEAMDIQMDTDESDADDGEGPSRSTKHQGSAKFDPKIAKAKAELNALLKQPILVRGISHRYITSGSRRVVDDIIAGNQHATMLGVSNSTAAGDAIRNKKRKAEEEAAA